MRFTLSAQHRDFAAAVYAALSTVDTAAAARAWADGDHSPGEELWRRLDDLGVPGLLRAGGDAVDLVVALRAVGYHAVPGPVVETAAVALFLGIDGERVTVGYGSRLLDADWCPVRLAVRSGAVYDVPEIGPLVRSVDPARRLFPVAALGTAHGPADPAAFDHGVLGAAAQLLGLGEWCRDTAVHYAGLRHQYGAPIGRYQAVKHLLADVACALEFARPLLHGAAVAAGTDTFAKDVSAARVACADAADAAARACLQVHGALGYTTEHPLSVRLTKVRALRSAWETQRWHRERVLTAVTGSPR